MKDVIIGTAGHIDHGKTSLIKALTGTDTDRFEEEKRRGISIDLGFAHMQLGDWRVGFIDVPGHEKFVKNMLAGIGGIHLALLVVAADESVMPQTIEHLQICKLLGIPHGVIAITKSSLVDAELIAVVEEEIRELVASSHFADAPIARVDSVTGEGLDNLRAALLTQIEKGSNKLSRQRDSRHLFRMPIDRVFTVRGFGTIVTGTAAAGRLEKGQTITVYPPHRAVKVRGIQNYNQQAETASAGQRVALNLSGLETHELSRGMVISTSGGWEPSFMLDTMVHLLAEAPAPLKHRNAIRFHHGSAELMGRIHLLDGTSLQAGQSGPAQIRLRTPTICCPGDRFVLRRYSPMTTIGGGVILDNSPPKHRKKDRQEVVLRLSRLASLLESDDPQYEQALLESLVESYQSLGATLPRLAARTGLSTAYLQQAFNRIDTLVQVPQDPLLAVSRRHLNSLKRKIIEAVAEFHQRQPLAEGLPRQELRERFLGEQASSAYFQFVLEELQVEKKIALGGSAVAVFGQRVDLTPEQEEISGKILDRIRAGRLQPPSLKNLLQELAAPEAQIRDVYYYLLKNETLVRVSGDIVLPAEEIQSLVARLREAFPSGQTFTVPDFKDLFGISRKYAIPFLEYLDRKRITRRQGDQRVVL